VIVVDCIFAVAAARGIFAVPTKAGERGPVLLESLGLDLTEESVCSDLLELYQRGEIILLRVDVAERQDVQASLRKRGVVPQRFALQIDHNGAMFDSVLVDAVAPPVLNYFAARAGVLPTSMEAT
jgi:hypothetical protein